MVDQGTTGGIERREEETEVDSELEEFWKIRKASEIEEIRNL